MKRYKKYALIAVVLLCIGTVFYLRSSQISKGNRNVQNIQYVKYGMSEADVLNIMGKPDLRRERKEGQSLPPNYQTKYTYTSNKEFGFVPIQISFSVPDDRVDTIEIPPPLRQ